jgi:cysteine-rich repeat protein
MTTATTILGGLFLVVTACSSSDGDNTTTSGSGAGTSSSTGAGGAGGSGGAGGQGGTGFGGFGMNLDCGNGVLDTNEACDDGNQASDDGCSTACVIECGFLCLQLGEACIAGFHGVQCDSPGAPFGQASAIANVCRVATLSVDGSHLVLSPETTAGGAASHLDAMYTDGNNALFGFAGDTENIAAGSHLVSVDVETGALAPIGADLDLWVMGAAMNDDGELWVTVFDTYEQNANTEVRIARVDPATGALLSGPTTLTSGNQPVTVWSTHVSDVAFRHDGAMFLSANAPGPPPPEPVSKYYEVDPATATVLSTVDGPDDLYAAGIVFVGQAQQILAMDIRGVDDVFVLDLAMPPGLNQTLLYPDPIPTNSGTADLAGCSKLPADIPF